MGVPLRTIWFSSPNDLQPYADAYKAKMRTIDDLMWTMGIYNLRAVSVSVGSALGGRKSKLRYFSEPLQQEAEKKRKAIEEEEQFYLEHGVTPEFAKFQVLAAVFNANMDRKQSEK